MRINRLLRVLLGTIFLIPLMGEGTTVIAGEYSQTAYNSTDNCYTCLRLVPSNKKNQQANPIYILEVYHQGQPIYTFETVTGRAFTQTRNRHRAGTDSPLPDGKYRISSSSVWGTLAEVGGRFIPIKPQFRTGRSSLGIHYDPSYNRANGEDGTSGCIGLTNRQNFEILRQFIETYKPQLLMVDIQ
ncbi:L,D-transpeptidase [Aphanothece sacrum]|uniref:ErfK/YbiS/YcfS/YnhG family protein n=1 Tax=Aphanothece sacrum FPU1 TaxID=1920663 RepID=A0A401IJR2_APHSA|nr:L,D-transpeptidase [Aphanothece sacrum]GBF81542.1 ErfK/YbiS/YcfS/YnhG family protein [Aphanothece sacrum FPU1]GBF87001.1 ErfK/YbiS/YcfS/YnhG family protein [Aphanothece sacrum FPU3]